MKRFAAPCALILLLFVFAPFAAFAETEAPEFIPPFHWTYHSLAALSSAGLLENEVVPGRSAFTPMQAAALTAAALKNAEDDISKLGEEELSALRQLATAYKKYFGEAGYEYTALLGDIDMVAMRAGLSAAATEAGGANTPAASAAYTVNKFAIDLYKMTASEHGSRNIMISPFGAASALACAYAGARGKTEEEMERVLYFTPELGAGLRALTEGLRLASAGDTKLNIANAVWHAKDEKILPEYIEAVAQYGAAIKPLDFKAHPEGSRNTINKWTEKNTAKTIKEIVPSGGIDKDTRFVLTNAVYFKSPWQEEFDAADTAPRAFWAEHERSVKALTMSRTGDNVKYAELSGLKAISLPYTGGRFSMLVLLPDINSDFEEFEKSLSVDTLDKICTEMLPRKVRIYLPKFRDETSYDLAQTLAKMGMPTAFDANAADFSAMTGSGEIYIADIFHKTFIDVAEEGTEASAATAVIMMRTSLAHDDGEVVFRADHPFVYIIRDETEGTILFIGRYMRP